MKLFRKEYDWGIETVVASQVVALMINNDMVYPTGVEPEDLWTITLKCTKDVWLHWPYKGKTAAMSEYTHMCSVLSELDGV